MKKIKIKTYKFLVFFVALAVTAQAFYPFVSFLPSFGKREIVSANEDILATGETEKVLFQNVNPEFKVEFGNKEAVDKPFVRFESIASGDNPFAKEENEKIKPGLIERLVSSVFEEKKQGVELTLLSAGTSLEAVSGQDPQRNEFVVATETDTTQANNQSNGNSNENSQTNKNAENDSNANSQASENKNEQSNQNDNTKKGSENQNLNQEIPKSNSNKNGQTNVNKNSSEKSLNVLISTENKNDNAKTADRKKESPQSLNTLLSTEQEEVKNTDWESTTPSAPTQSGAEATPTVSDRKSPELIDAEAELRAEEQILNQMEKELDNLMNDVDWEISSNEELAQKKATLKKQIIDELTREEEAKAQTVVEKVALSTSSQSGENKKDVIKNNDFVPGVDAEYSIKEGEGVKEEIIIKNNEGFSNDCLAKKIQDPSVKCSFPKNMYSFSLKLDPDVKMKHAIGVMNQKNPQGVTYFEDSKGKYLFHFENLFAVDAKDVRTDAVKFAITEKENQTYDLKVIVDPAWLFSSERAFPVRIDPSIVHNTKVQFDAGSALNRVETTSDPKIQSKSLESSADVNTVGLWHMNETSGTTVNDSSGRGNNGTATGTTIVDGKLGKARSFNGSSDYASIPNNSSLNTTSQMTVEYWMKPADLSSQHEQIARWNYQVDGSWGIATGSPMANNELGAFIMTSPTDAGNTYGKTTDAQLQTNNWYHISMVFDGSGSDNANRLKIFVNGVQKNLTFTGTIPATLLVPAQPLYIGRLQGSTPLYFSGLIDEVKISNIALTPEQIKADYSKSAWAHYTSSILDLSTDVQSIDSLQWSESGVSTGDGETPYSSTGLVGQWKFNETSGTTAADSSGGGNNGTLTNFSNTTGQDVVVNSGWTANNGKWPRSAPKALMFDGSDDTVSIPGPINAYPFTASVWVTNSLNWNPAGTGTMDEILNMNIAGQRVSLGVADIWDTNGEVTLMYGDTNHWGCGRPLSTGSGDWHNITWVVYGSNNTNHKVYIDGILQTMTNGGGAHGGSAGWNIGSNSTGSEQWPGTIDNVQIYNRALSADEILANYNATNIEFQTRTGTDATPDDGGWEEWKPSTSESQMLSMDADKANWEKDAFFTANTTLGENSSQAIRIAGVQKWQTFTSGSDTYALVAGNYNSLDYYLYKWMPGSSCFGNGTKCANSTLGQNALQAIRIGSASDWQTFTSGSDTYALVARYYNGSSYQIDSYLYKWMPGSSCFGNGTNCANSTLGQYALQAIRTAGASDWQTFTSGTDTFALVANYYNGSSTQIDSYLYKWVGGFALGKDAGIITKADVLNIKEEGTGSMKVSSGQLQPDANTVGLWHLDETGGSGAYIKDYSGNGNHGTPTGTTLTQGRIGKARSFNGSSDYIDLPANILTATTTATISMWFKSNTYPYDGDYLWIYDNANSPEIRIYLSGNSIFASGYDNSTYQFYMGGTCDDPSKGWHHVALTLKPNEVSFYIDGKLFVMDPLATFTHSSSSQHRLGYYSSVGGSSYFNGLIDEVKISNIARTHEEIAEEYRMGRDHRISRTISSTDLSGKTKLPFWVAGDRPGTYLEATVGESAFANGEPDANTVGLWHLDEQSGSGAYIKDSSNFGNHGTPTGTTFTQGKIGKARNFDGSNDVVNVGSSSSLDFGNNGAFTFSGWIRPTTLVNYAGFVGKDTSGRTSPYSYMTTFMADGRLSAYNSSAWVDICPAGSVVNGNWYYVVFAYNGSTLSGYVNGNKCGSIAFTYPDNAAYDVTIGSWYAPSAVYDFNGIIDEVRIDNVARTASEIRQAYEVGLRTHPITVEFNAKLDSGNLITGSGDTSFTIDTTASGSYSNKGENLYQGDKIIIKENYDGTEYLAQGTVTSVNTATGAVTVASWDSGSTFPGSGFTANATVFKWQQEWMDLTSPLTSHINDVARVTLRSTDGNEGRNIFLDDFKAGGPYLTTPNATGNVTSTKNRYMQYRALFSTRDGAVTPALTGATVNYSAGPSSTDVLMRHGKWFDSSGTLKPHWWGR